MSAEVNGSNAVHDRPAAAAAQASRTWIVVLPAQAAAAGLARRATSQALQAWQLCQIEEAATLVVSELVSNAVVHARSSGHPLELHLHAGDGTVRVEVHDGDPRQPQVRCPAGLEETGRGLLLVEALSRGWGVRPTAAGKAVWAEVAIDATPCP